jgi:cytochrome oxidase assembly protein ShyY1
VTNTREHPAAADSRPRRRWAFLLRPGWIAIILAAFAFAAACFLLLSPWQFDRNNERSAQNTAIDASITAPAVPVTDLLTTTGPPPQDVSWRVVTASGEFDQSRQFYVRLRQDSAGQPVSEVIAPFRLDSGESLLVDRGYVSFGDVSRGVTIPALPAGQVTITGRVQQEQVDPANRSPVLVDGRVEAYAISSGSLTAAAELAGTSGASGTGDFLQGYIQLTANSPGVLTPIDLPQTDAGPFLSYALQWAAFGVIALIGLGVFLYREAFVPRDDDLDPDERNPTGQNPEEPDPAEPQPATRRRARDGFDRSQLYDD